MKFELDKEFDWFLEQFGEPQHTVPVTKAVIDKYRGRLPNRLLDYWQEYGFCGFKEGLFWIVNPDDYEDLMNTWLKGTGVDKLDNFHVFARSGFSSLYLWGEKTGHSWRIDTVNAQLFHKKNYDKDVLEGQSSELIKTFFAITSPEDVDLEDVDTDEPLFEQAVDKFGPLKPDEMFTFEPALFLGGEQIFKTVNKANLFIQCEILASMGQREIMDIKGLTKKAFGK